MTDLMLDIETFGTSPSSVIAQVGACYFDRRTGEIGGTFLENLDWQESVNFGFKLEVEILRWWFNQSDMARMSITAKPSMSLSQTMVQFKQFSSQAKSIWCHATFDYPLVEIYMKKLRINVPFNYQKVRDIRTLLDLSGLKKKDFPVRVGTAHTALADCKYQVSYCVKAFQLLSEIKDYGEVGGFSL